MNQAAYEFVTAIIANCRTACPTFAARRSPTHFNKELRMLNHYRKSSLLPVRREFSGRRSNRLILSTLGVLLLGNVLATGANAARFRESQDSFGNIARPYRAGTLPPGTNNSYSGSVNPIGGDQNDVLQFTLSRTATVTIVPSRAMEVSVFQGYRLLARNHPASEQSSCDCRRAHTT